MIPDLDLMGLISGGKQSPPSDFRMELLKKLLGDLGGSDNNNNKVLEISSVTAQPFAPGKRQKTWMDLLKGGL